MKFRHENPNNDIVCHPFVIGEITVGPISDRKQTMRFLYSLNSVEVADHLQVIRFVNEEKLYTKGLSFMDCHLLMSAIHTDELVLWTHDKQLARQATERKVNYFGATSSS